MYVPNVLGHICPKCKTKNINNTILNTTGEKKKQKKAEEWVYQQKLPTTAMNSTSIQTSKQTHQAFIYPIPHPNHHTAASGRRTSTSAEWPCHQRSWWSWPCFALPPRAWSCWQPARRSGSRAPATAWPLSQCKTPSGVPMPARTWRRTWQQRCHLPASAWPWPRLNAQQVHWCAGRKQKKTRVWRELTDTGRFHSHATVQTSILFRWYLSAQESPCMLIQQSKLNLLYLQTPHPNKIEKNYSRYILPTKINC